MSRYDPTRAWALAVKRMDRAAQDYWAARIRLEKSIDDVMAHDAACMEGRLAVAKNQIAKAKAAKGRAAR